jgi:hypothetical protein
MKKLLLFLAAAWISVSGFAQRLYFCEKYTDAGEPIGAGTTWNIKPDGGFVYLLFQNGGKTLNVSSITFYIDKLSSSSTYTAFDNKYPSTDPNKTWAVLDYKFMQTGDYKVTVLINSVEVAKEYVSIKPKDGTNTGSTSSVTTLYYSGATVTPGTDINLSSGLVYNANGPFYLNDSYTSTVYFKVSNNGKNLSTNKLIVDIYKMNGSGTYDFSATKYFDITDKDWVYFSYAFGLAGSYKVNVYNGNSTWINTAYLTVNNKTGGSGATNTSATNTSTTTDYYSGSSVTAGTSIDFSSGYVYGATGTFERKSLINKKIQVYFKVSNAPKSINTNKLIVDYWKMNKSGEYDVYKTENLDLKNSTMDWVYFSYEFKDAGSYKVMVYNGSQAWINTAYVTIK